MVPFGLGRNGDGTVADTFWCPATGPSLKKGITDGAVDIGKKQDVVTFGLVADGGKFISIIISIAHRHFITSSLMLFLHQIDSLIISLKGVWI